MHHLVNYSQIMSPPRPPLPRKVGGHDPSSSYGSAAPGFISAIIQDRAIVTIEGEQETVPKLSNGTSFNDLE